MIDLKDKNLYINRELSWLEFNARVLEEAFDKTNPIIERFKFLAITASNMDEFFMVRVSGLMDREFAGSRAKDISGLTPSQQLSKISENVHSMVQKQYNCLNRSLLPKLEEDNIKFIKYDETSKEQKEYIKEYFNTTIFPILTPMAIDSSRPFPLVANKTLNLIVEMENAEANYAVVQIPAILPRLTKLPTMGECSEYIYLEEIIRHFVDKLFSGYKVRSAYTFRITRNSDLEIDEEEARDLLSEIENSIKQRKWGQPVRLEVEKTICANSFSFLKEKLELTDENIYLINGAIDLTMWFALGNFDTEPSLKDVPMFPQPVAEFNDKDMFDVIKEKDVLVHHPYESFDCVVNFVRNAANDPDVLAIKQTLYRVSGNSPIIKALIQAAENGKQVTVLVELKARFDEENNINWARKLEKAGCHVVYGLVGLKTHCKLCLIVRREEDGIKRYVHLGTGNYNDKTAKTYTDLGFFTSKESYGYDISALFNVLTGYSQNSDWNKIAVAPTCLREMFISSIENEAKNALEGKPARIIAKMNSLVDFEVIQALYRASMAGVKIHLIVRGICCLKSGIEGISDNITVTSIVGRFLEHSRIYYFENIGNPKFYLSSADWMNRNLDKRVEVAFRIEDDDLKNEIFEILNIIMLDSVKARIQQPDGSYKRIDKRGKECVHSQEMFYKLACEKFKNSISRKDNDVFVPITNEQTK